MLVVIAIIAILAAILFPVFATAREKARQTSCLSNCKQQALATITYLNDDDETFPLNGSGTFGNSCVFAYWQELTPYEKSAGIWECPDAPTLFLIADWASFTVPTAGLPPLCVVQPMPIGVSYTFNTALISDGPGGKPVVSEAQVVFPDITSLFYDGSILLGSNLAGTNPPNYTSGSSTPGNYPCETSGEPLNPVHGGGSVANVSFVDGHSKALHVAVDKDTANGAAATCTGVDGQTDPIGYVTQAGPYQGSAEIYGIPIAVDASGPNGYDWFDGNDIGAPF